MLNYFSSCRFQVAPAELEDVLTAHPDLADSCVIGVWSKEDSTELVSAIHTKSNEQIVDILLSIPCRVRLRSAESVRRSESQLQAIRRAVGCISGGIRRRARDSIQEAARGSSLP